MKTYAGLCAGGPNDGNNLASQHRNVIIALRPRMNMNNVDGSKPVHFEQGVYKFRRRRELEAQLADLDRQECEVLGLKSPADNDHENRPDSGRRDGWGKPKSGTDGERMPDKPKCQHCGAPEGGHCQDGSSIHYCSRHDTRTVT